MKCTYKKRVIKIIRHHIIRNFKCWFRKIWLYPVLVLMFLLGLLSHVRLFVTPWTAAHQAALSSTTSWNFLKFMSIESVMLSNHLILCHPWPSVFPNIRVFAIESPLPVGWPKYWSFSNSHSNEYSALISFGIDIPRQITWIIKKKNLV